MAAKKTNKPAKGSKAKGSKRKSADAQLADKDLDEVSGGLTYSMSLPPKPILNPTLPGGTIGGLTPRLPGGGIASGQCKETDDSGVMGCPG